MRSRKATAETIRKKMNFIIDPPVRDQLLAHALQEQERSWKTESALSERTTRRMIMRISIARMAIAILIGAGVVTAGVVVGVKYRFIGRDAKGRYLVQSEDGRSTISFSEKQAASPEQAMKTAEEYARLRLQGQRELVNVSEVEVNGKLDHRMLSYKYSFSDGRTITMPERDPDDNAPWALVGERQAEAARLLQEAFRQALIKAAGTSGTGHFVTTDQGTFRIPNEEDKEMVLPTTERVVYGRTFAFERYTFTLSDGTKVAWSIGRLPEDRIRLPPVRDTPTPSGPLPDELREWVSLRKQGKGQLIGVDELTANGKLDRRVLVYRYQLSNGQTMDMREDGEGAVPTPVLSPAQREEWVRARKAGSGQGLGEYEEQVKGRTFVFTRQRFVLSDGTALLWSYGKPKDNQ